MHHGLRNPRRVVSKITRLAASIAAADATSATRGIKVMKLKSEQPEWIQDERHDGGAGAADISHEGEHEAIRRHVTDQYAGRHPRHGKGSKKAVNPGYAAGESKNRHHVGQAQAKPDSKK